MKELNTKYKHNYVYKITNNINGKVYIGKHSTNNIDDGYMGSGKIIKQAIRRYGNENFEFIILKSFKTQSDAYAYERLLVNEDFVNSPNTYNLTIGGGVIPKKYNISDAGRMKLSRDRSYVGINNPNYGKGYKQSGERNGRHRNNYKGDYGKLSENISNALKNSTLNKKGLNSASKKYYIIDTTTNIVIDLKRGYLYEFCNDNNIYYGSLYNTLSTNKPIGSTRKYSGTGLQLFEGSYYDKK